jgi:deoxyribodipyrimidine photolyase
MERAMRAVDNPALDVAIEAGNLLGLPVVVYAQVIQNDPNANLRHYHFLVQGLRDVQRRMRLSAELGSWCGERLRAFAGGVSR